MNRLPRYDFAAGRFERVVYASLGLAALALVGITLVDALRFSLERDEIVMALSRPTTTMVATTTNNASTNLTSLLATPMGETSRLNNPLVPKS